MPKLTARQGLIIAVAIIAMGILFLFGKACNKPVDQPIVGDNPLQFSLDGMKSVNKAITMDYEAFKHTSLSERDSLVKVIQAQASSNTISIAAISTKVSSQDSGKTVVTVNDKPVSKDSLPCDPVFSYNKTDSAEDVHVRARKDSTFLNFTLFNIQTVQSKFVSSGFLNLGAKSIVLEVTNSNPKIRTLNQISFVKPLPKPNKLIWLASGIIAGGVGVLYLKK